MSNNKEDTKRIAKNTLILYIRTIFTMLISLYTSRVILNALGVEDYGVNNVVGGLVSMFSIISSSITSAISRYITFGLGKGDIKRLQTIFSTSVNVQLGIALFVLIIGVLIGFIFLNTKMSIPSDRLYAANWVLLFSIVSFSFNLVCVPYISCIVAHERMYVFAYMSILETILKLIIVYLLYISPFDKLITYSVLFFSVSFLMRSIYVFYCKRNFWECKYEVKYDKILLKEMAGFAGWSFFGNTAYILNTQGVNVLINIFFGVSVNAARGIAEQVQNAVLQFVNNFTTAINPQITKSYANNNNEHLYNLICQGAKFSIFLLLLFTVPIFVEAEAVLKLWLGIVPEYSVIFLRLVIISSYVTILGNTSFTAIMATGKIRNYQIVITIVGCMVFPITWIIFKMGMPVYYTYLTYILIYFILNFIRLYYLNNLIKLPITRFLKDVLLVIIVVAIPSFTIPFLFTKYIDASFFRIICTLLLSFSINIVTTYIVGLKKTERHFIDSKIKQLIQRIKSCH